MNDMKSLFAPIRRLPRAGNAVPAILAIGLLLGCERREGLVDSTWSLSADVSATAPESSRSLPTNVANVDGTVGASGELPTDTVPEQESIALNTVSESREEAVAMESWYIDYIYEFGTGHVSLRVFPKGDSLVLLTGNLGKKQEIGRYRHKLPLDLCTQVRTVLHQSKYTELKTVSVLQPGSRSLTIGEGVEGSAAKFCVFKAKEPPTELKPVMEIMKQAIDQVRQSPDRVLAGEASWDQEQFTAGKEISFTLTFRNIGISPLEITNPAGAASDDGVRLFMTLARNKPTHELQEDDFTELELGRINVRPKVVAGQVPEQPGPTVRLMADDEYQLSVHKKLLMAPGEYKAVVTFQSVAGKIDPGFAVEGALAVELKPFKVVK